jgi:nucleoside 2-deoxyribosyltransferase
MNDETKSKFSHLLAEHKLKNLSPILLASSPEGEAGNYIWTSHRTFLNNYPKDPLEILDRVLLNLSRKVKHPSESIRIDEGVKELFFSNDINGIMYIIRQLANQEYITPISSTPNNIFIESNGWRRIDELRKKPAGLAEQVFVAMWFDNKVDNYFNEGIQKAVEESIKYKVVRVDLVEHNNKICDQIIAEINKSKLLIADFTGNRGGVYFEAGYAQGLGIPVIWTVHKDWIDKLHFDTRQYNHIVYENEADLYKKLKARIEATILKMA